METNNTVNTGTNVTVSADFTHKDKAVTAMIFGIVSILTAFAPLLSIASIIFGAVALKKSGENKRFALEKGIPENGMNSAGYVTGLVGVILGSIMTLIYLLILAAIIAFAVSAASGAFNSVMSGSISIPAIEVPAISIPAIEIPLS